MPPSFLVARKRSGVKSRMWSPDPLIVEFRGEKNYVYILDSRKTRKHMKIKIFKPGATDK
jgi:hypothetical protein